MAAWREQYCIEVFLPLPANEPSSRTLVEELKGRLADKYGGVTAYAQAPAEGLWTENGAVSQDRIVVLEVLVDDVDTGVWTDLKHELERRLHQTDVLICVSLVRRIEA